MAESPDPTAPSVTPAPSLQLRVLTRPEQVRAVVEKLRQESIIAFDTEFIRETSFYPNLEIIQLGHRTESWIVDIQAFRKEKTPLTESLAPLIELLLDPKVLKVVHAAAGDQEAVLSSLGILPQPVFDTAVGAALCGLGESIGLGNLLKAILNVKLNKGHARTHWGMRPLPDQLIEYALSDVEYLVALAEKLFARLERLKRKEWALLECTKFHNPKVIDPGPPEIAAKLARTGRVDAKGFPILIELLSWRERRVRELNRPRKWVAEDSVLIDLAHVRPTDLEHLSTFRGINKGELKTSAEEILQAIRKGLSADAGEYPMPPRNETPQPEEARLVDVLRCIVGILSDELELSTNLLISSNSLIRLIRTQPWDTATWVDRGILSAPVAALIGKSIESFLKGHTTLIVHGEKVKINSVHSAETNSKAQTDSKE